MMHVLSWLLLPFLSSMLDQVTAGGTFYLHMVEYLNPGGRDADGDKCDTTMGIRTSDCDYFFVICIGSADNSDCSLVEIQTGAYENRNDVTFGSTIANRANPIIVPFDSWPEAGVKIKVVVYDEDSRSGHDHVDTQITTISRPGTATSTTLDFTGRNQLRATFRSYCDVSSYGDRCEIQCTDTDDSTGHYTCSDAGEKLCNPGWEGSSCSEDRDECSSNPCQNGGQCSDLENSFSCVCTPGYTATTCSVQIDECLSDPCINGGTCNDAISSYTCACPKGFNGVTCHIKVDPCDEITCQNGGTCTVAADTGVCNCPTEFTGVTCSEEILVPETTNTPAITAVDPCSRSPCVNGSCQAVGTAYTCSCQPDYTGTHCDTPVICSGLPCIQNETCVCENGGSCVEAVGVCICPPGWTGAHCNMTDHCHQNPCIYGTCESKHYGFVCNCLPGKQGQRCDVMVPHTCDDSPCRHGGTCRNDSAGYQCACTEGYEGQHCQFKKYEGGSKNQLVFKFLGNLDDSDVRGLEMYLCELVASDSGRMAKDYRVVQATHGCQGEGGVEVTIFTFQVLDSDNSIVPWHVIEELLEGLSSSEKAKQFPRPFYDGMDCSANAHMGKSKEGDEGVHPPQVWVLVIAVACGTIVVAIIVAVIIVYKRKRLSSGRFDLIRNPAFEQERRGTTDTLISINSGNTPTSDTAAPPVYFRSHSSEYGGGTTIDIDD